MRDPFWQLAFEWAYGLGESDVEGLLARTPLSVFLDWQEYWSLNPPTEERADWRAANLACVVQGLVTPQGHAEPKIEDHMPQFNVPPAPERQTAEDMEAILMAGARKHNARLERRNR